MAATLLLSAMAKRLEGKVAMITGGGSGVGKCTARLFSQHGAKVVIADIQHQLGRSVSHELGSLNSSYIHCDVTDEDQVRSAVDQTVELHGKLDIMFANAGIIDPNKPSVVDHEKADFERVLSVNVTGAFLCMKHAARVMIPARSGSIIATASVASKMGGLSSHAYCCSKHAILGLTRNMGAELGQFGIRVNCLSPYGMATPLSSEYTGLSDREIEGMIEHTGNLKGRILKVDDVANAAVYLGSDEAQYVSGHNLVIDGGFSIVNSAFSSSSKYH